MTIIKTAIVGSDGKVVDASLPSRLGAGELNATYAIANPVLSVTRNIDGTVASTTENGVVTTYTYNTNGTVATSTRGGVTRTFSYDANGNVTGAA
jgi:YD repeat-containing protein